jgi:putative oxidoreductase
MTAGPDRVAGSLWTVVLALGRLAMAAAFWSLGRAAADGFVASDDTKFTFEFDYQIPLVNPYAAAHLVTVAELALAALLLVGLGTRPVAAALLVLTAVIQIWIAPDETLRHALWAIVLAVLVWRGGGRYSVDGLLARRRGG